MVVSHSDFRSITAQLRADKLLKAGCAYGIQAPDDDEHVLLEMRSPKQGYPVVIITWVHYDLGGGADVPGVPSGHYHLGPLLLGWRC